MALASCWTSHSSVAERAPGGGCAECGGVGFGIEGGGLWHATGPRTAR